MIKIKDIIGLPSLQYHVDNNLSLHENVYRYSSESYIQLFAEARDAWRDGIVELEVEDANLIETTDIGLYGEYNGQKVPLDLPMLNEIDEDDEYEIASRKLFDMTWDEVRRQNNQDMVQDVHDEVSKDDEEDWDNDDNFYSLKEDRKYNQEELLRLDLIAHRKFNCDYEKCTDDQKAEVLKDKAKVGVKEAKYKGKDVPLNKPKRGGSKKFFVYTKNKKGNVVKVSFGGTTGLSVKIKEKGARASFAARHKCATKKDKTKPGYWACNVGRYWKSLGGAKNFSGYW